jgi:hypothetical protein
MPENLFFIRCGTKIKSGQKLRIQKIQQVNKNHHLNEKVIDPSSFIFKKQCNHKDHTANIYYLMPDNKHRQHHKNAVYQSRATYAKESL